MRRARITVIGANSVTGRRCHYYFPDSATFAGIMFIKADEGSGAAATKKDIYPARSRGVIFADNNTVFFSFKP